MGCSICISRINMETFEDSNSITLDEWLQVVEDDKELKRIESTEGINPITKEKILIEIPGNTLWKNPEKDYNTTFYYLNGRIYVDDFNECLINKMRQLSKKLNAKVLEEL